MHLEDKKVHVTCFIVIFALLYRSGRETTTSLGVIYIPWTRVCAVCTLPTRLTRAAQLLQRMLLHWHAITPKVQFTSGLTLAVHSVDLDRCIIMWGWDGCVASPTGWTWVWASSGSWWWTGKPGVLQSTESQRVGHDWVTELTDDYIIWSIFNCLKHPVASTYSSLPPNPRQPLILCP